jgi:hypothetical protein
MMRIKTNLIVITACAFNLFTACDRAISTQDKPVQVAFIDFEDDGELLNWNLGSVYGHTELDQNIKFAGTRSIHFSPDSGCYVIDRKTGIEVQSGKRYSISFNVVVTPTQIGDPSFCAGDFILTVKQGNEEILYQSVFDAPDWEKKTYYFIAKNNLPVNLNLIVGNDVWLDDLTMVRELE